MLDVSKIAHCRAELRKLKLPKEDKAGNDYTKIWSKRIEYHSVIAKELRKERERREQFKNRNIETRELKNN